VKSTSYEVLITHSCPAFHHFLPLRSKYSPKHPVFKHPQYKENKQRGNSLSVGHELKCNFLKAVKHCFKIWYCCHV